MPSGIRHPLSLHILVFSKTMGAKIDQTWMWYSFYGSLTKLCTVTLLCIQDGCHGLAFWLIEKLEIFENLLQNHWMVWNQIRLIKNNKQKILGWSHFKIVSQLSKMAATADYATFGFPAFKIGVQSNHWIKINLKLGNWLSYLHSV